jgi:hypothetical protein
MIVQVNDKLCAVGSDGGIDIVVSVTASGRIKLSNGKYLNPDLSIRSPSRWGPYEYRIPTSEDFRKYRRRVNATELDRASRMVREYTDEQIQKIADCIREVTGGTGE